MSTEIMPGVGMDKYGLCLQMQELLNETTRPMPCYPFLHWVGYACKFGYLHSFDDLYQELDTTQQDITRTKMVIMVRFDKGLGLYPDSGPELRPSFYAEVRCTRQSLKRQMDAAFKDIRCLRKPGTESMGAGGRLRCKHQAIVLMEYVHGYGHLVEYSNR